MNITYHVLAIETYLGLLHLLRPLYRK